MIDNWCRLLRIVVFLLLAVCSSSQSKLFGATGNLLPELWKADTNLPGGVAYSYYLVLQRGSSGVSGRIKMTWAWEDIRSSTVAGDHFTLHFGSDAIPIRIEGDVEPNTLKLVLFDPRTSPVSLTAKRVESLPQPSGRLPLPALRPVQKQSLLPTPPMGWNSWNALNDKVDDKAVRSMADLLVSTGLRDAGYRYVLIDDTWAANRGADGQLHGNTKFPDMAALAAYVHARGLLFGLYSSPGPTTCGAYQGSYGHEEDDAKTFAAWGVDYLKYDWCSANEVYSKSDMQAVFQKMGQALANTGGNTVFSICQYGLAHVETWGRAAGGELWRTSGDIADSWKPIHANVLSASAVSEFAGPDHWNDPDLLQVGNGGMSNSEYRTQLSLWAIVAAPFILSNDLRLMSPEDLAMLMNPEVIAIDQDRQGTAGTRISDKSTLEVWRRKLAGGGYAIAIVNGADRPYIGTVSWDRMMMSRVPGQVRDLWQHKNVHVRPNGLAVSLAPHATQLVRIQP